MQKKILIVSEYFYPEEFKINELALFWIERGYEVGVLTRIPTYPYGKVYKDYKNFFYSKDNYKGIEIYRLFATTGYQKSILKKLFQFINFALWGSVVALFIGKKYDFVFSFNQSALTAVLPAVVVKKIYKKRLITWTQDIWPDSVYTYGFKKTMFLEKSLNWFVSFVYNNVDHITVSCEGFISKLSEYVKNKDKFTYIPQWADSLESIASNFELSDSLKVHFTFAGNISKAVNLDNILVAFNKFQITNKNFHAQLNIVGDGSNLQFIKDIVQKEKIKNVVFWGRYPKVEMKKFFDRSNYLIISLKDHPLYSIMIPAKFQTYLATHKPIFAIMNGVVAEIVKKHNIGITSKPDDILMISQGFKECYLLSEKEILMVKKNSDYLLMNNFNKDVIQEELTNILTSKN